uniref:Choline transporter-like protein n=1 Tax=Globisporangium ultimum (strain ATCC 200006 / CBS 805.95 / DAOM BR144) TaxID=431595 RepID=K3X0L3_GLOUD
MYQATHESEPMLGGARSPAGGKDVGTGSVRSMRLEAPAPRCNDWIFAMLFIVHVVVIGVFAFWKGVPAAMNHAKQNTADATPEEESKDFKYVFALSAGLMGIAVLFSLLWMKFLMANASSMIRIALWFNVGLTIVSALTTFAVSPIMGCLLLLAAGINVWYIYAVQDRIAFASANLKAACAAVSQHTAIFAVAFLLLIKQTVWLMLWSLSAIGIYQMLVDADPGCDQLDDTGRPQRMCGGVGGGFTLFFLLISVYWGQQVIQNILTCTTSGVVASWWYQPNPKNVTLGALYRSLTSSFGSICFGSLIVAVLQALRTMATILKDKAREDDNAALACVACLAECILNCLEGIMEYINQWAYVYVGIYGYDFRTSGKAVMDLFTNRGWTAVINDDLTSSALTFGALGVGFVTCIIGLLIAKFTPDSWLIALGSDNSAYAVLGVIGFISGLSMAMILANVVITALHTVFVCFAEDPIAFNRNHPREYEDLVGGWRKFHGDALVSAYGSAV